MLMTTGVAPACARAETITPWARKPTNHAQPYIAPWTALRPRMPCVRTTMCQAVTTIAVTVPTPAATAAQTVGAPSSSAVSHSSP